MNRVVVQTMVLQDLEVLDNAWNYSGGVGTDPNRNRTVTGINTNQTLNETL